MRLQTHTCQRQQSFMDRRVPPVFVFGATLSFWHLHILSAGMPNCSLLYRPRLAATTYVRYLLKSATNFAVFGDSRITKCQRLDAKQEPGGICKLTNW